MNMTMSHMARTLSSLLGLTGAWGWRASCQKQTDAPYRSGPSKTWLKSKNPASDAVRREREDEWR